MRKPIVAANWKMHKTPGETADFLRDFVVLAKAADDVDIVIAPPFVSLAAASTALAQHDGIKLAAQNMFYEQSGAFTGEISPIMLREMLINYVILGHSERRQIFGESDAFVNRKVLAALKHGITPILCIGETLQENESGQTEAVLERQVAASPIVGSSQGRSWSKTSARTLARNGHRNAGTMGVSAVPGG